MFPKQGFVKKERKREEGEEPRRKACNNKEEINTKHLQPLVSKACSLQL